MGPVRLGLMAPLSGLVELWGEEISHAGKIAVQRINDAGGLLGRPLELVIVDDGSQPDTAVPSALKLVKEHRCHGIIGNLLSNSRIAVNHEVATPFKVPYLNFSFYEGSISGPFYFNFSALPNQQIDYMVPYMAQKYGNKFFFAGSNYEWPRGSIDAAKSALLKHGGTIVGEEYFEFGTTDYSSLLEQVKKEGTEVFVPYFAGQDQIDLLTQFEAAGLKDKVAVVMGHYDEVFASHLSAKVRSGLYSSNTYFMTLKTSLNVEYLQALAKLPGVTGIWPEGNGILTNFGEGVFACVTAFAKAVELVGGTEPKALAKVLKNITIESIQGTMVMDPLSHHASVNGYLSKCNEVGQFDIVKSFGEIAPVIPERYQAAFSLDESQNIGTANLDHWQLLAGFQLSQSGDELLCLSGDENFAAVYRHLSAEDKQTLIEKGAVVICDSVPGAFRSRLLDKQYRLELSELMGERYLSISRATLMGEGLQELALNSVDMAFMITDPTGNILLANHYCKQLFGYQISELIGQSVSKLIPPRFRNIHDDHIKGFLEQEDVTRSMNSRSDLVGYRKDGSEVPIKASIGKLQYQDQRALTISLVDISKQKVQEARLTWQATHDPLTKLPNKKLINSRIKEALERSKASHEPVIVLFLDLDGFKIVNDSYGHTLGDRLLIEVSELLLHATRPGDTVARFGGDEFVILLEKDTGSPGQVAEFVECINQALRRAITIDGISIQTTVSIGVAIGDGHSHNAEDLVRNADTAMYSVKDKGRDGWTKFDETLYHQFETQRMVAGGLVNALTNNELMLFYQPIVDVEEQRIVGAEALCRWSVDGRMVSPGVFIPVAEATGQIVKLGYWAFETVCRFIDDQRQLFSSGQLSYISINVSAYQLQDRSLADKLYELAVKYGISTQWILLEITETAMMKNLEGGLRVLKDLGQKGFHLAIDDFGTGYSSLGQLMTLPVQKLKIDKVFIDKVAEEESSQLVVSTIEGLAHGLKMKIIAEGVETSSQFEVLERLGIDYIQGYLFYKPLPENTFIDLLL